MVDNQGNSLRKDLFMMKILNKLRIEKNVLNVIKGYNTYTNIILNGERQGLSPKTDKAKMATLTNYFQHCNRGAKYCHLQGEMVSKLERED